MSESWYSTVTLPHKLSEAARAIAERNVIEINDMHWIINREEYMRYRYGVNASKSIESRVDFYYTEILDAGIHELPVWEEMKGTVAPTKTDMIHNHLHLLCDIRDRTEAGLTIKFGPVGSSFYRLAVEGIFQGWRLVPSYVDSLKQIVPLLYPQDCFKMHSASASGRRVADQRSLRASSTQ